jgi:hypothetical protein
MSTYDWLLHIMRMARCGTLSIADIAEFQGHVQRIQQDDYKDVLDTITDNRRVL